MNVISIKDKIDQIDQLIKLKATGTPKLLAEKLNTTERSVYRIIKQLKELGCPIYFDNQRQSYCYKCKGKLKFKFETEPTDNKTIEDLGGGVFHKRQLIFSH